MSKIKHYKNVPRSTEETSVTEVTVADSSPHRPDDVEVLLRIATGLDKPVKAFEVRRRIGYTETVSRVEMDNE